MQTHGCKLEAWLLSNDLGDRAMLSPGLKDLKLRKEMGL
jgi:hypothetical protein